MVETLSGMAGMVFLISESCTSSTSPFEDFTDDKWDLIDALLWLLKSCFPFEIALEGDDEEK